MQYLAEILDKEVKVYEDYLDLATQKKQALMNNDMQSLEAITIEEKGLSTKILALEAARTEFLREQGHNPNTTLDELLTKIPEEESKSTIKTKSDKLRSVLGECKAFNDNNMALLRQSSNYINHMIKIFTKKFDNDQVTYSKSQQKLKSGKIADMQG